MTPRHFIISKLEILCLSFPLVKVRYGMDSIINTHVIELTPESEFYSNEALDMAWFAIMREFYKTFPGEDICFISSDSTVTIDTDLISFEHSKGIAAGNYFSTAELGKAEYPKCFNQETSKKFSYSYIGNNEVIPKSKRQMENKEDNHNAEELFQLFQAA